MNFNTGPDFGLGMNLVDRRIKARFGDQYGLKVESQAEVWTRVEIHVPAQMENKACMS